MKKKALRFESLLLVLALVVSCLVPGFGSFVSNIDASAATHEIDIIDADGNSVTDQLTVMESEQLQLSYKLIDCSMPDGGYVVWKSNTPLNASVDQTGLVRGHDASKGAAVRLWLENDVKTVPIIGKTLANTLEDILFADNVNLDTMDTEAIVELVSTALGGTSGTVTDSLLNSLRKRLNELDTTITLTLYDQYDTILAADSVHVLVTNSDKWYANVIPNGAFILNKDSLPTTVAVGGKLTIEGGVTPLRLGYGVTWSLETDSIFKRASDYAEFDEGTGEITFLKEGTVTVKISPNADEIVDKLMSYINDLASLGNAVDTGDIAEIVQKVLGLNVSVSTVKFVIDIIAAVAGAGTNTADLITQAVKYVSNWLLEATINDEITFTIVDSLEIKSFSIGGNLEVEEGETSQLSITDVVPAGANSNNIVWSVEDESVAYVDQYGILIGRDAGGISSLSKKTTKVTASVDGISASAEVTVKGKLITQPVDIAVNGPSVLGIGETAHYTATVYPSRSSASVKWGLVGDDGSITYASSGKTVSNSCATIDSDGNLTAVAGGTIEIAVKAGTLATCKRTYSVYLGILSEGIEIDQGDFLSVEVPLTTAYNRATTQLTVSFNPPNASNQNVRWKVLEGNLEVSVDGVVNPKSNTPSWGVVQATAYDGGYADTITVAFANYPVTGVSLSPESQDMIVGDTLDIKTSIAPLGTGIDGAKIGDASIKDCYWTSSDDDIASVDKNGKVTARDSGTCTITATTVDGGFTATTTITVRPDKSRLNYAIELFESGKITAENCSAEDWEALNKAYQQALAVSDDEFAFQVTCDGAAQEIIDLFDKIGAYVQLYGVDIMLGGEVAPLYNTVEVSTSRRYTSYSLDLDYRLTPEDAMYSKIEWTSSSSSISVDENGVCTPTSNDACAAVITLTVSDYVGNKISRSVVVAFANHPVTGVTLDKTEITDALVYNTGTLKATIAPEGFAGIGKASITDVVWASTDESVVSVDQSGNLTYNGIGTADVMVVTVDGGHTATCRVTVSVNKTALSQTIAVVEGAKLVEEQYTVETFDAYKAAYEKALAVMDDPDATQEEVNSANSELNKTYNNLKKFIKTESVIIQVDGEEAPDYISVESALYSTAELELSARVLPLDSMYVSVVWSTDSSSIKVDENGKVTPASSTSPGYGWVTVTVTDQRGNVVTDKVHVSFARYPVTDISISPAAVETSLDEAPVKLSASCKHQATSVITYNASITDVYWSSSDETIVSVDSNGQLTYHNAGQVTITATAADGGLQATCIVTVAGDKSRLRAAIAKADEANINIQDHTYETSMAYKTAYDHAIDVEASVKYTQEEIDAAADALLLALNNLEDYIHMTSLNVYYNGSVAPEFIAIDVPSYKTFTSQSVTLTYDYAPSDAMFSSIEWSSSDSSVTVTDGVVKPAKNKACGAAISLTATDHYGNTIVVTTYVAFANYEPTGISIDKTAITVNYGAESQTIKATVSHESTDYLFGQYGVDKVVWRTSDPDVATVDENGVVTFVESGTCTITASTIYGGFTASCDVTVLSDITPLQEVYAMTTALNLKQDEYTAESWAPYIEAYNKAAEVLAIDNPKQRDIDAASAALWDGYNNLEKYVKVQSAVITYNGADAPTHISQSVSVTSSYTSSSIGLGYRILPSNATWASVTWTSSNSSVAVTNAGVCTPTSNEACWSLITLCVTDTRGRTYTDTVYVAFANYPVTGISVSPTQITDAVNGSTAKITYSITPKATLGVGAASVQDVTWVSSDESIAVVSDGVVEFHGSGTVRISAITCDGGYQATTVIKVYANKSALKEMIDFASTLVYTDYTPASWKAFEEKYNNALSVYGMEDPSQADVDKAYNELNASISDLVEYIYVSDVSVKYNGTVSDFINVIVGEDQPYLAASAALELAVTPSNAMYTSVEWSYSGDVVLNTVSGLVAPMVNSACYGKVNVKLTDDFGNVYQKVVHVTFTRNPIASVTLDKHLINAAVNDGTYKLNATVLGENGEISDIPEVIWSSSDPSVASVDENGKVTIHAGGYAEITVMSVVGTFSDVCKVYVTTDKSELEALLKHTVEKNYQKKDYIESTFDNYLVAYNNAVSVYSNNEASQDEIDSAVASLKAAIDALKPYVHVESIVITNDVTNSAADFVTKKVSVAAIIRNKTVQLSYTINPGDSMFESVVWSSDSSDITVDQNGLVKITVNKPHVAGITLTVTDYYGVKYEKTVYVAFTNYPVTGISISKSEISGYSGGYDNLSYSITPKATLGIGAADIQDVIWSSSDESVATVNQDGKVVFVDAGQCTVTVTSKDGGYSASCKVTVTATDAKRALAEAIAKAKTYNSSLYTEESYAVLSDAITHAESVYNTGLATTTQINEAIALLESAETQLVYTKADYTNVNNAIELFNDLNKDYFAADDIKAIQDMIDSIDWELDVSKQDEVDSIASDINFAVSSLVELDADYSKLNDAIDKAQKIDKTLYQNSTVIDVPLENAIAASKKAYKISEQSILDSYTDSLVSAMESLKPLGADKSALKTALELKLTSTYTEFYDAELLDAWQKLVAEGNEMFNNSELTVFDNEAIASKAAEITAAYEAVEASYNVAINTKVLEDAIKAGESVVIDNYYDDDARAELISAIADGKAVLGSELVNAEDQTTVNNAAKRINDAIEALNVLPADYADVNSAIAKFNSVDKFLYTDESVKAVQDLIDAIDWELDITKQDVVTEYATKINNAIDSLALSEETKIEAISTSGSTVDSSNKFIYGVDEGIEDLNSYVRVINGSLKYTETDNGFGTGTTIDVLDNSGNVTDTYTLVIFGDANGDGVVDGQDSVFIWMIIWSGDTSVNAYNLAADANRDGVIDASDAELVEKVGALSATISQK